MLIEFGFIFGCIDTFKLYALGRIKSTERKFSRNRFTTVGIVKRLKNGKFHILLSSTTSILNEGTEFRNANND